MIKTDEQLRISKDHGNRAFNNKKTHQDAGKESWRKKKNTNGRGDIWKKLRENTVFAQHWHRRCKAISTVCEYPVPVQSLTKQHPMLQWVLPSALQHGQRDCQPWGASVCLSAISQAENLSWHQTWPASAQLAAHHCRTCKQQGRPRWRHPALGWGWDRKTASEHLWEAESGTQETWSTCEHLLTLGRRHFMVSVVGSSYRTDRDHGAKVCAT